MRAIRWAGDAKRSGVTGLMAALLAAAAGTARAAPPDPAVAMRAAQYGLVAAPLHYAGSLQGGEVAHPGLFGLAPGVPAASGPARLLRVGLYPADAQGRVQGSALLLDEHGAVLAGGPVEGTQHGPSCRLHLSFGGESDVLDGSCSLSQLSGTLTRRDAPTGYALVRFLLQQGGARSDGEAWLAAE